MTSTPSPSTPQQQQQQQQQNLLQFESFSSAVDATFWHALASRKVELFRLDDGERDVQGYYPIGSGATTSTTTTSSTGTIMTLPARLCVGHSAFEASGIPPNAVTAPGILRNTNTIEDFKAIDKAEAISSVGKKIWDAIQSGEALKDPSLLSRFLLITFADLKKYKFYFWFAFPAFNLPNHPFTMAQGERAKPLKSVWTPEQMTSLHVQVNAFRSSPQGSGYFLIKKASTSVTISPFPLGWPLRNLLVLAKIAFKLDSAQVVCYRETSTGVRDASPSLFLTVELKGTTPVPAEAPKCVGWEKNVQGKLGPRLADLAPLMDPLKLADTAVDLNLKLMRWRIMPEIQLEKIAGTKCLLLGSGTLGCYVARALLAWGVRHITFVDSGVVSFSNPVRQPLFTYEDCLNGGAHKAKAAAAGLKRVFPGVETEGINLSIPMPGHFPSSDDSFKQSYTELHDLIERHDAIFLLTDSREARWLPTLLGAKMKKIVITAAIGFDTFVVMRHGMRGLKGRRRIWGVISSLSDRTLDQQCTVSRPGLSLLASGQAVELLVSILNHPDGALADGDKALDPTERTPNFFGLVPHQIRGFLAHFGNLLITGRGYDRCIGCSEKILAAFEKDGFEFVKKGVTSPKYLEEVTGLAELHNQTDETDLEWMEGEDE
ncbi:hypothetical protein BC829DRAFT_447404 [Chytridium lagenaria]|nr:hypothetical protein BC829DRAFT_447404 [Chytridium lagenaria]